jgi:hypothetical protein
VKRTFVSTGAAVAWLALGAWLAVVGCLNPRPEELPSGNQAPDFSGGIEGDDPDDSATPLDPSDGTPEAPTPGASEETPPSPSPRPDGEGQGPADAGAPDAGPRALESGDDAEPPPETGEPPE